MGKARGLYSLELMSTHEDELEALRRRVEELEAERALPGQMGHLPNSQLLWETLVSNAPETVFLVDRTGKILFINRTDGEYSVEDVQGQQAVDFAVPEHRDVVRRRIESVFADGQTVTYEVRDILHNRWYGARLAPVMVDGEVIAAVAIVSDMHDRRIAEEVLRQNKADLEMRVAERTKQLEISNVQLRDEQRLLQRLLDVHDVERQLIAYEIHDGIAQDMAGALMFTEAVASSIPDNGQTRENIDKSLKLLRDTIDEARRLINGLRPAILEEQGVVAAVENLVGELQHRSSIPIDFRCKVEFDRLAPALEMAIYRIVQEGLNNAVNHSQSPDIYVELIQNAQSIHIIVRDSGIGFDTKEIRKKRYGLMGVRERARLLGGKANIQSKLGVGSLVEVILPLTDLMLPTREVPPNKDKG